MTHKILVVDDEPMLTDLLDAHLTQRGYLVYKANDADKTEVEARSYLAGCRHAGNRWAAALPNYKEPRGMSYLVSYGSHHRAGQG